LSAEVGACSWIGCDRAEDRLDSLMPCPIPSSSGGGCLENYNPSDSMPSENEIEPAQAQHDLDGAWELMSNHHSRSLVRDKFSVFVIAGDALTLKDKKSYRIELGQEPNTMLFGDSLFEVVANGIAWLHCMQSRGCVCYRKVDLPTPQFLFSIQGAWEYCGGRLGTSAQTLTMQGPWWHLFDGYESSRGLVRLSGFTGTPVLKLFMRAPVGVTLPVVKSHGRSATRQWPGAGKVQPGIRSSCPAVEGELQTARFPVGARFLSLKERKCCIGTPEGAAASFHLGFPR